MKTGPNVRVCPACGETLIAGRCPDCTPASPARSYVEAGTRQPLLFGVATESNPNGGLVDVRRATSEWMTAESDYDPHTRRAHPTHMRAALAEAEERARERAVRETLTPAFTGPRTGRRPTDGALRVPVPPPHALEPNPPSPAAGARAEAPDGPPSAAAPDTAHPRTRRPLSDTSPKLPALAATAMLSAASPSARAISNTSPSQPAVSATFSDASSPRPAVASAVRRHASPSPSAVASATGPRPSPASTAPAFIPLASAASARAESTRVPSRLPLLFAVAALATAAAVLAALV